MDTSVVNSFLRPSTVRRAGYVGLTTLLAFGLLLILFVVWAAPDVAPFFPLVVVVLIGAVVIFHYPLVNLCLVLASFVLIADFEAGFQPTEILYGLYFLGFLGHWFFTRVILYRENIFRTREDRILVVFLGLATLSFPLTLVFGGSMTGFVSEWLSLSFLGFYFPIREAVERNRRGLYAVLFAVAIVGVYVLVRNLFKFSDVVSGAEYAFEVARGRAVTNESLLIVPAITCLVFMLFQKGWPRRLFYAGLFLAYFAGVLLTQSRGYWVAFLFAALTLFLLIPNRQKIGLILSAVITIGVIIAIGIMIFGDTILLLVFGVLERFLSILTASTADISLVNRFTETIGVWEYVKLNPILGYGMGVEYRVQDIIYDATIVKTFIHNGYIALMYKFGIWGTGLVIYFFASIIRRAYNVYRSRHLSLEFRLAGLAVIGSFASFSISALTSNPIYINDAMFILSVLAGIAGGCWSLASRTAMKTARTAP